MYIQQSQCLAHELSSKSCIQTSINQPSTDVISISLSIPFSLVSLPPQSHFPQSSCEEPALCESTVRRVALTSTAWGKLDQERKQLTPCRGEKLPVTDDYHYRGSEHPLDTDFMLAVLECPLPIPQYPQLLLVLLPLHSIHSLSCRLRYIEILNYLSNYRILLSPASSPGSH